MMGKKRPNRFFSTLALVSVFASSLHFSLPASAEMKSTYIIKFGQSSNAVEELDRLKGAGIEIQRQLGNVFPGAIVSMTQGQAEALTRNPRIAYVEKDQVVSINAEQSNATWGIDRIDTRDLPLNTKYAYTSEGSGVTAYVIDTGILTSHNEFKGRVSWGTNTVDKRNTDCNGHGTHVAGTIGGSTYGVAKKVQLIAVKVLGCNGSGTSSGVIAGIDWVVGHHTSNPAVANMSLGAGDSLAMKDAVQRLTRDGVLLAVAAGNETTNACTKSPANAPSAITVGATNSSDSRASFSNFGDCVDIFAPGQAITSAWSSGNTAINTISGTSMASPHVAGVLARMISATGNGFNATCSASCDSYIEGVTNALISASTKGKVVDARSTNNRLLYIDPTK